LETGRAGAAKEADLKRGFLILGIVLLAAYAVYGDESEAPNQAVALGNLGRPATLTVASRIDYQGDDDWFSFRLAKSGRVAIYPAASQEVALRFVLYSADLALQAEGGEWLLAPLTPGEYLVKADSPQGTGDYRFYISTAVEEEPNGEARKGLFLGALALDSPLAATGAIEPGDDVDYFTFEIGADACSDAVLRISSPRSGTEFVDMTLYRLSSAGRPLKKVAESSLSGTRMWSVVRASVEPGKYGIKVEGDESRPISFYDLTVRCFVPCRDREPNDDIRKAVRLGALSPGGKLESCGYVEGKDQDFFYFSLTGAAEVAIFTSGPDDGDSVLQLVDPHGHPIATDDNSGEGGWSRISVSLNPGDYYVVVSPYAFAKGGFEYHLTIQATPRISCIPEREPNDEFTSPMRLGTLPACVRPATLVVNSGDFDMFQFQLYTPSRVVAEVIGDGNFSLYIADAQQPWNIFAETDGYGSQSLEVDLKPGLYLLAVGGFAQDEYMVVIRAK
jgi:hypothetical protein